MTSSLSSVVSNLVRAQMGASVSATVTDEDLDRHVAELILKEAKQKAERYTTSGVAAYLPQRLVELTYPLLCLAHRSVRQDGNAPKTNKRFLSSIIRSTDDHNKSILRAQAEAAEDIRLQREEEERCERRKRAEEAAEAEKMRMRRLMGGTSRRDRDYDYDSKRKRRERSWERRDDNDNDSRAQKEKRRARDVDGERRRRERGSGREREERRDSRRNRDRDEQEHHPRQRPRDEGRDKRRRRTRSRSPARESTHERRQHQRHRDAVVSESRRRASKSLSPHHEDVETRPESPPSSMPPERSTAPSYGELGPSDETPPPTRERKDERVDSSPLASTSKQPSLSHSRTCTPPPKDAASASSLTLQFRSRSSSLSVSPGPSPPSKLIRVSSRASPCPPASPPPAPPPLPSKMDRYFEPSYDPRLDTVPLMSSTSKDGKFDVPKTGLIPDESFAGWDAMLDLLKQRRADKEEKKRLERSEKSKDKKGKKKIGAEWGKAGLLADESTGGEGDLMRMVYKKKGAVREWDLGKEEL
jgi:hypothetical protein